MFLANQFLINQLLLVTKPIRNIKINDFLVEMMMFYVVSHFSDLEVQILIRRETNSLK